MEPKQKLPEKFQLRSLEAAFKLPKTLVDSVENAKKSEIIGPQYPYKKKLSREPYEEAKVQMQIELVKLQKWLRVEKKKVLILFEGRDAAGKGGTIKRFMEHLNPRYAKVVALTKPSEKELGQWYLQRYIQHFPSAGEIVLFDRSWYNRAGVERVMGFCSDEQHERFLKDIPSFEETLQKNGIHFLKIWFSVSRQEQLRRFLRRAKDPLKQWKLSPIDYKSLNKWDAYTNAKMKMFERTDTDVSPWIVIRSDDKKRARLQAMSHVLGQFDYADKNKKNIYKEDPKILGRAVDIYEEEEKPL